MSHTLILGKIGQLGWELERTLSTTGRVTILDYPEINFLKPEQVKGVVAEIRPDVIFNAVAYTNVDKAESEYEIARMINSVTPGELAEQARKTQTAFIHYSTDFVFDGTEKVPYSETNTTNPINAYGKSKLEGELAVESAGGAYIILRTSWLYSTRKDSFLLSVLRWARNNKSLRIVSDQVGSPTWARMLAEISAQLLAAGGEDRVGWLKDRCGVYHLGGSGYASRLDWAKAILSLDPNKEEQIVECVEAASTEEFPSPARRPSFSALDCSKFERVFGLALPPWQEGVRLALEA